MDGYRGLGLYVAFLVLISAILGAISLWWQIIGDTLAEKATRTGIVLEVIGILSAIPDIVGERTTDKIDKNVKSLSSNASEWYTQINALLGHLRPSGDTRNEILEGLLSFYFNLSGLRGLAILLGNALASLVCVTILASFQWHEVSLDGSLKHLYILLHILVSIYIVWWLLFIISEVLYIRDKFLWVFGSVHMLATGLSVPYIAAISSLMSLVFGSPRLFTRFSLKRTVVFVTVPLVLLGNLLQLIATFL